ncbi:MAG: hypothetical protein V9E89_06340 [Ilumatobacteraceae bacterium]
MARPRITISTATTRAIHGALSWNQVDCQRVIAPMTRKTRRKPALTAPPTFSARPMEVR